MTIGTLQIPTTSVTINQFYNNSSNVCTFNKSQDLCNFTISFFRIVDDGKQSLTASNPNFAFIFVITGINKADNPDRKNYLMKIN